MYVNFVTTKTEELKKRGPKSLNKNINDNEESESTADNQKHANNQNISILNENISNNSSPPSL